MSSLSSSRSILGMWDGVASDAIAVNQNRCAKVRNRNVACLKCADACTSGCITLENGELVINAARCVGCGTCATVCPTCALEARSPTDEQLLSECLSSMHEGTVTIVCKPCAAALEGVIDPSKTTQVVCAGRVDESLILQLAAAGASRVCVVCGSCASCEQERGLETAELVLLTAGQLLKAWNRSVILATECGQEALLEGKTLEDVRDAVDRHFAVARGNTPINPEAARKELPKPEPPKPAEPFTLPKLTGDALEEAMGTFFRKHEKVKTQANIVKVMKDGTLPHFIPDRRERLLNALAALGEPVSDAIGTRLWGCIVIDGTKCASCRMCATFCPTGAIAKFDDEDGTFGVNHFPGDCVKCGSCRDICEYDAIRILDNVSPAYVMDGTVHRYAMKPRAVEFGPRQMKDTMQGYMDIPIYER